MPRFHAMAQKQGGCPGCAMHNGDWASSRSLGKVPWFLLYIVSCRMHIVQRGEMKYGEIGPKRWPLRGQGCGQLSSVNGHRLQCCLMVSFGTSFEWGRPECRIQALSSIDQPSVCHARDNRNSLEGVLANRGAGLPVCPLWFGWAPALWSGWIGISSLENSQAE